MKTLIKCITLSIVTLAWAGCASILNPYNEDFACPESVDNGKCVPLKTAYDESVNNPAGEGSAEKTAGENHDGKKNTVTANAAKPLETARETYRQSLYGKLGRLIEAPITPMVAPAKVVRALLLPYEGSDNALYMYRYIYFIVEKPQWILDEDASIPSDPSEAGK